MFVIESRPNERTPIIRHIEFISFDIYMFIYISFVPRTSLFHVILSNTEIDKKKRNRKMDKAHQSARVSGLAVAPKEIYINDLNKYSSNELLELRDRQLKLLVNK